MIRLPPGVRRSASIMAVIAVVGSSVLIFAPAVSAEEPPAQTLCGYTATKTASGSPFWDKLWSWLPFVGDPTEPTYAIVVKCYLSPGDVAKVTSYGGGNNYASSYMMGFGTDGASYFCNEGWNLQNRQMAADDLGRVASGSQTTVTFGCNLSGSFADGIKANTGPGKCAYFRILLGWAGEIQSSCSEGFYSDDGSLNLPELDPNAMPDWLYLPGCTGLTIKSGDVRKDLFVGGETVPMKLAAVNPASPPEAVTVKVWAFQPSGEGESNAVQIARLGWPGQTDFSFTVDAADTDQNSWRLWLECSDGTDRHVVYDPSGEGGIGSQVPKFSMSACLDEVTAFSVTDAGTWLPGLAGLVVCSVKWAVVPPMDPISYLSLIRSKTVGGPVGTVVELATAPIRAARGLEHGAPATIPVPPMGEVPLPPIPPGQKTMITNSLSLLAGFALLSRWWKIIRWGLAIYIPSPTEQGEMDYGSMDVRPDDPADFRPPTGITRGY